jgi:hypothetical protein
MKNPVTVNEMTIDNDLLVVVDVTFPKQYKQATLFAYVETRIQQQTAPTTQNT